MMIINKILMIMKRNNDDHDVTKLEKVGRRSLGQTVTFGGLGQIHFWVRGGHKIIFIMTSDYD